MNRRPLLVVGLACVLVMVALNAWAWITLPAGTQIPQHFGPDGQPDSYASTWSLALTPAISVGLLALLYAIPSIEPRRANLARTPGAYNAIGISALVLMVVVDAITIAYAKGNPVEVSTIVTAAVGLMFVVIGVVMPRLHSSYLVGVRTPWTLTSELSWRRTHVLAGWLFGAFGVVLVASAFLLPTTVMPGLLMGGVAVVVIVPTAYSYVVWRGDPDRHDR